MDEAQELKDGLIRQVHNMGCMMAYGRRQQGFRQRPTIQGLVLQHGFGRFCLAEDWPGIKRGLPKLCYSNAYKLMRKNPRRFIYTEGYGSKLDQGVVVGTHAWILDKQNNYEVIDPTWVGTKDAAYIGIPFSPEFVTAQYEKRRDQFCILDDWPAAEYPPEQWMHPDAGLIPRDFAVPENMPDPTIALEKMKQSIDGRGTL